MSILKYLASNENSVRIELSNRIDVYYNILRSKFCVNRKLPQHQFTLIFECIRLGLFLYPNNESVKTDGAQLLALLLYNSYIMRLTERTLNNPYNISLPYIITVNMKLPFACKAHWKMSVHKRSDVSGKKNQNFFLIMHFCHLKKIGISQFYIGTILWPQPSFDSFGLGNGTRAKRSCGKSGRI